MNRIDHNLRNGDFGAIVPLPHIPGADAACEVVAVGAYVTAFKVGDHVVPMPGYSLLKKRIQPIEGSVRTVATLSKPVFKEPPFSIKK